MPEWQKEILPREERNIPQTGEGFQTKVDNVLDLWKDEKLKVQLEIRKLASELKKEVTNTSSKKTEAIAKMDKNFDKLIHTGIVEKSTLDTIKNETLTDYVDATADKTKNTSWVETADKRAIDETIDDTNKLKIKETTVSADGSLVSTKDTPDGSAARLKAIKDKAKEDKKIDIEKSIDASLNTIDGLAEAEYLQWSPDKKMTQAEADIAFTGFASNVAHEIDNQLLTVQEQAVMGYRFQVLDLKYIIKAGEQQNNKSTQQSESGNTGNTDKKIDISDIHPIYLDRWETKDVTTDVNPNFKPSENIYKNNHMHEAMKKLLKKSNNTIDKLSNGTFGVNLSKEDGFAGIIGLLSQKGLSEDTPCVLGKYNFMIDKKKIKVSDATDPTPRDLKWQDLKSMQDQKPSLINYKHEEGSILNWQLDNEWDKMTKIMNAANWSDLQDFADISGVRDAQYSVIKETVNAKESLLLDKTSVFKFLCDRNGDGVLSANNRRNKEQKNLGDIGNIFGQQLNFTIEQAMKVQDVLHPGQGEQIVIQNIMRTIMIQNPRVEKNDIDYNKLENCTRVNLVASIKNNPKFKTYFTAAIEKINGSSSVLTPDLYDTLTGNTMNTILKSQDWEMRTSIKGDIDKSFTALIKKEKNKKPGERNQSLIDYLEKHTTIELRENLISQIMNIADGFTLVGSDTQAGYLRNPGLSKEFVDQEAKNKFINDLTKQTVDAIAVGLFSPENGIRIPVSFVKNRRSKEGRTLASINAGIGAGYNWMDKGILLTAGLGGDVAEQYNYNKVINAKLDVVKTAQYLGGEGQISLGFNSNNPTALVEGSAGVEWIQDRITGINQINRQYESMSDRLFGNLTETDLSSYDSIAKAFENNINTAISKWGEWSIFVKNNQNRLQENARFIVSFLKENQAIESISNKKPGAINGLISIIQEWNIEQWRSDLLNNVNGKFDISKLSFGVTTNALTIGFKNSDTYTKVGDNNVGANASTDVNGAGTPGGAQARFGLAGFYVGMRISNWQTKYHVNENQLVNSRRKVAEGINVEDISMKNPDTYAKYLSALFNKEGSKGLDISFTGGKIVIINYTNPKVDLPHLLNIRVTDAARNEIVYNKTNDSLIIGNVWDISASTVARADGVERRLCLGSKKYNEGKAINIFNAATDETKINTYKMKESGKYESVSETDILNLTANKVDGTNKEIPNSWAFANNEQAKQTFLDCFNEHGQIWTQDELPDNVYLKTWSLDKISAGSTIVFKHEDGDKYSLYITKWDEGKVSLRFVDKDNYTNGEPIKFENTSVLSFENIQDKIPAAIRTELSSISTKEHIKAYWSLDIKKGNYNLFKTFMDASTLSWQTAALLAMVWNDGNLKNTIASLKDTNQTSAHQYIVDQFKWVFAYSENYENKPMSRFYKQRSINGQKNFLKAFDIKDSDLQKEVIQIRKNLLTGETTTWLHYDKNNWENVPNLVGFTAFYREHPQAGLISVGDTKIMKVWTGPNKLYSQIKPDNIEAAKDWVSDNLENHKEERALLIKWIKDKLATTKSNPLSSIELGNIEENFSTLLKTWELILDNWNKKVILDTTPVFYLKAECVNESLGLLINSVTIQEARKNDVGINKEYLVNSWSMYNPAASPTVGEKTLNGKYYGSVNVGDWSYTDVVDNNKGGDKKDDVNGTQNNQRVIKK